MIFKMCLLRCTTDIPPHFIFSTVLCSGWLWGNLAFHWGVWDFSCILCSCYPCGQANVNSVTSQVPQSLFPTEKNWLSVQIRKEWNTHTEHDRANTVISEVKKRDLFSQPHSLKRCLYGLFHPEEASNSLHAGVKPPQPWEGKRSAESLCGGVPREADCDEQCLCIDGKQMSAVSG